MVISKLEWLSVNGKTKNKKLNFKITLFVFKLKKWQFNKTFDSISIEQPITRKNWKHRYSRLRFKLSFRARKCQNAMSNLW